MSIHALRRLTRFAPLAALALAGACADLTGDGGGDLVAGLTIQDGSTGATLVTVNSANSVSGSLTVARSAQRPMAVVLRTAGGAPVVPGISESIRITITNPNVASWAEVGGGTGTLRGHTPGTTSMRVDLIEAGTVEYTSPSITITVS